MTYRAAAVLTATLVFTGTAESGAPPARARYGMVVSQHVLASRVGQEVLWEGGNAIDAAVATAFALAVVHPAAGNIGGGGFLLFRPADGEPVLYDFRETAPAAAAPVMFLKNGRYDPALQHEGHHSVGVPGTVAGLHLAWKEHGRLPWKRLIEPAIELASEGFEVSDGLALSLQSVLPEMKPFPASIAQFSHQGVAYEPGDPLIQKDLARTLTRIAAEGPPGFYEGETARLIAKEMRDNGGLLTEDDLRSYRAVRRTPLRGSYRGFEVVSVPPPSSGGITLLEMLNILEGFDLAQSGFGAALTVHRIAEAMRRAYADRARYLGDPEANPDMPIERLGSKEYAAELRRTLRDDRASVSSPDRFEWPPVSDQTTHLSVVDKKRDTVSLTYTLEDGYGSKIVVPGAGFLLNNEMGDFNAGPGLTDAEGLIGTAPNLAAPGKRMLSSMTPTILARDGKPFLVLGSPGGRTIINTVLLTILNVVDFGMNVQEAIDSPRFHHQWLPDAIHYERFAFSPDTLALLSARGHRMVEAEGNQGVVTAVHLRDAIIEGGADRRAPDSGAVGR